MSKPLSKKAFLQRVADATVDAGFTVDKLSGETLHIEHNGQMSKFSLATVYSAYQQAPERLTDIINAHVAVLQSMRQLTPPGPEPALLDSHPVSANESANGNGSAAAIQADELLLPVLQQRSWLDEMKDKVNSIPIHKPFVTGLIVAYVIDTPAFRTYFNEAMLARVVEQGVATADDVYEDALNNLRGLLDKEMQIDTFNSFAETIITCETREGYASSCILLPELMEEWDKRIPGEMLIGIPNRDFIIAFSHKHPAGIEGIETQVAQDARTKERPLSGRLLKWKDGNIREFRPLN